MVADVAQRLRVARVDLHPEDVEGRDRLRDLQEALRLEVEVQVHEDVDVRAGALTKRGELLPERPQDVAIGVQLGEAAPAREAGRVQVRVLAEDEHVGLERGEAALAYFLAGVHHVLERPQRRDLHRVRPGEPIRAAVRPVETDALAHRPAQHGVHGQAERLRLDVEQRVLDGADRLLDDAAAGLPPDRVEQGDDCLVRRRILADDLRREAVDHGGHAEAAERFVVLAPADQALVGADFQEIEVTLAGVRVQMLDLRDLHA